MNKEAAIHGLKCCVDDNCGSCPWWGEKNCVTSVMRSAAAALEGSEDNGMSHGCVDFDEERERIIAEREKMVAEINYQRQHLDEVLQENKLLQAQMHIVHMIFGRRNGNE